MGAEKSGVGAVSIRRREAVGLGHGDIRTKPISIVGTERQQTVHSRVSGVLASWDIVRKTFRPGGFTAMAASSGFLIAEVERCFPVRIRIGVRQTAWALGSIGSKGGLGENCGTNGWR